MNLVLIKMGGKIKSLRTSKRMTQNQLAMQCNFEKARMSRIESGQINATIKTLHKISNALDVQIIDLFQD